MVAQPRSGKTSVVMNAKIVDKVRSAVTLTQKLRRYAPLYIALCLSTDVMPLRGWAHVYKLGTV